MSAIEGVDAARVHEIASLVAPHIRRTPLLPTASGYLGFGACEEFPPTAFQNLPRQSVCG